MVGYGRLARNTDTINAVASAKIAVPNLATADLKAQRALISFSAFSFDIRLTQCVAVNNNKVRDLVRAPSLTFDKDLWQMSESRGQLTDSVVRNVCH